MQNLETDQKERPVSLISKRLYKFFIVHMYNTDVVLH